MNLKVQIPASQDSAKDPDCSGIYQIRDTVTGKRYIGSAKSFKLRWRAHRRLLSLGQHHSRHLQNAWSKNGPERFAFEVIENCSEPELIQKEQAWMDECKPEFNVCPTAGSSLGRVLSEETKRKIAQRATGRKNPPRSDQHRKNISNALAGKPKAEHVIRALQAGKAKAGYSDERRAKVSESLKISYASGMRSRVKTESHKQKIGKSFAALSDEQVRAIRVEKSEGATCAQLSSKYGCPASTISQICTRKRYRWVE